MFSAICSNCNQLLVIVDCTPPACCSTWTPPLRWRETLDDGRCSNLQNQLSGRSAVVWWRLLVAAVLDVWSVRVVHSGRVVVVVVCTSSLSCCHAALSAVLLFLMQNAHHHMRHIINQSPEFQRFFGAVLLWCWKCWIFLSLSLLLLYWGWCELIWAPQGVKKVDKCVVMKRVK